MSNSPLETEIAGEKIAAILSKGSVLALQGPLGAGKTCFVKGIARFLGIIEEITSPTYTIISEYEAVLRALSGSGSETVSFFHIDAYRLEGDDDFAALGGEEYLGGEGIAVVEWCERIGKSLPAGTLHVKINILEGGLRQISLTGLQSTNPAAERTRHEPFAYKNEHISV